MAGLLASYLLSNGATDKRHQANDEPKHGKDAKREAKHEAKPEPKPDGKPDEADRAGRKHHPATPRPGPATETATTESKHGGKQKLSKRGKAGTEELPKAEEAAKEDASKETSKIQTAKSDAAKPEGDKPEAGKPAASEAAKPAEEAVKPADQAVKPSDQGKSEKGKSEEGKSETAKVDAARESGGSEPTPLRPDPVPPVTRHRRRPRRPPAIRLNRPPVRLQLRHHRQRLRP